MKVFAEIYEADSWTNGSGPGSHPAACRPLIRFLDRFFDDNKVTSIVDFGCGDWQFMSQIDLTGRNYIGLDVVEGVLASNRARHGRSGISFAHTPEDLSELPRADLLLIKDVMIHLDNKTILDLISHFSKYKYVIAVNNVEKTNYKFNSDIEIGEFHPVDLALPPFGQPCATVLTYGSQRQLDPDLFPPLAKLLKRYIWPGEKHVQLLFGRAEVVAPSTTAQSARAVQTT